MTLWSYKHFSLVIFCLWLLANCVRGQVGQCTGTGCSCSDVTSCCLQVEENVDIGTHVGFANISAILATAIMEDGAFYAITTMDPMFTVDRMSGSIATAVGIDRETEQCTRITIAVQSASSSMATRFAIEIIDKNDNPPRFTTSGPISISFPETTVSNPIINCDAVQTRSELNMLMAEDDDSGNNSQISYSIPDSSILRIPDPDILCINNIAPLDRDASDYTSYVFTLVAADNGVSPLSSNVTVILSLQGVNEFSPTFPSTNSFQFPENSLPGFVIHQFQATDEDKFDSLQIIRYSMPQGFPFTINETTGELSLIEMVDADSNPDSPYSFTVTAQDMGPSVMTGTIDVTVTVTDVNEPADVKFDGQIIVTENENITDGIFIQVTDRDAIHTNNFFQILSGEKFFTVEFDSVASFSFFQFFRIELIKTIDREKDCPVVLRMELIQEGDPRYDNQTFDFPVTVRDVNDNAPSLNITSFDHSERSEGTFDRILAIANYVTDPDEGINSKVSSITLISVFSPLGEHTREFINFQTGNTRDLGPMGLLEAPPLDREEVALYTINVNITDRGEPPMSRTATFTLNILDINDNSPVFEPTEYSFSIRENQDSGTNVGRVMAVDADKDENSTVVYILDSEDFRINSQTGMIESQRKFDRESMPRYDITVNARDNGPEPRFADSMATVTILIEDVNDNSPVFSEGPIIINLVTNQPVDSVVRNVAATDADEGVNGEIVYKLEPFSRFFNINGMGDIILTQSITTETILNLTVIACNPGQEDTRNASVNVSIFVNAPVFGQMEVIVTAAAAGVLLILVLLAVVVICCCCCRNRQGKYNMKGQKTQLNNLQPERINSITKPILKTVPAATNGSAANRGRVGVKFSDRVDETIYDRQGAVVGDKVLRKASITNFGSSDESPQVTRGSPVHNGVLPPSVLQVIDLENSPGQQMNGLSSDLAGLHPRYEMHHLPNHPPIHLREDLTDNHDFSQGTSSTTDVNSYNSEGEEESTFSDGASNMNTSIPCFSKDEHSSELHRYGPPPSHPALYTHLHSSHMPSPSLLGIIHPGNMSSLAAPESSYRPSQGDDYITRHSQNQSNSSLSSQTTPSPSSGHQILPRMEPSAVRPVHTHANGKFSRPLVMPDAYPPAGLPDIRRDVHRCVHEPYTASFSDYGETSTYASTELDEALNCNYEAEPGFYSLTATDYDDQEDTMS